MKKVIKVSIGNVAFTLEEGAHKIMQEYLDSLSQHYASKESGKEVVDSIEERIAELLLERGYKDKVVEEVTVEEIVLILGSPEEIEDEEQGQPQKPKVKRKLYRDLWNKVFGGVLSGLAEYFKIDPTAVRIIYSLLTIVFAFGAEEISLLFPLFYIFMWIIVPGAKTVEQRCEMKGESAGVDSIEKMVNSGVKEIKEISKSDFWGFFGKFMTKFIGVILFVIGFFGLIACVFTVIAVNVTNILLPFTYIDGVTMISGLSGVWSVVLLVTFYCVIFLPFVGMLYGGIQMLFGFKSPRWRPGLIIFILWILSIVGFVATLVSSTSDYWEWENKRDVEYLSGVQDTVYVKYADLDQCDGMEIFVDASKRDYELFFVSFEQKKAVSYPELSLRRDTDDGIKIVSTRDYFPYTFSFSDIQEMNKGDLYQMQGDTLTIYPKVYNKNNPIKEIDREVVLHIPSSVKVIVDKPIYHDFTQNMEFTDIKYLKRVLHD